MSEQSVEIVRLILEGTQAGIAAGDLRGAVDAGVATGIVDPEVELRPAPELVGRSTYHGADGFVEFVGEWTEDFDEWSIELDRTIEATQDRVVAITRQRGVGKRSGVPIELAHGIIFELDAGRVTRVSIFATPEQALEATR